MFKTRGNREVTMLGTFLICASAAVFHFAYCELPPWVRSSLRLPPSDTVAFSAKNVHNRHYWCWFTASCLHGDRSHLVNNLFFVLGFAPQLEDFFFKRTVLSHNFVPLYPHQHIGSLYFMAIYFLCGIGGWAMTYASHRWLLHSEQWKIGVAQHISTVGSSPNMYGLALFAFSVVPFEPVGIWPFGRRYAWAFCSAMLFLPLFFTNRYGLGILAYVDAVFSPVKKDGPKNSREKRFALNRARATSLRALFVLILFGSFLYAVHSVVLRFGFARGRLRFVSDAVRKNTLVVWQWVALYFVKVRAMRWYSNKYKHRRANQTDNASHFGGALFGIFIAYSWIDVCCSDRECFNGRHRNTWVLDRSDKQICYVRLMMWVLVFYLFWLMMGYKVGTY